MDVSETIRQIRAASALPPTSIDEEGRKALLQACEALRVSLENPLEFAMKTMFAPYQAIALRLGVDIGLFDAAAKLCASGDASVSVEELTAETASDRLLITRTIRMLAGMSVFKEVAKDTFQPTVLCNAFSSRSPLSAGIIHITENMIPLAHLPQYFSERGWKCPDDAFNGPFQYGVGTDKHAFEYIESKPKLQQAFNTTMALAHRRREAPFYTYFAVDEKFSNIPPTNVLLVDVGGGQGADLAAFKKAYPDISGKLILQDLPAVISSVDAETLSASGIEAISHNFFHPQPIKNARCYYIRTVLHDWPDLQAQEILGHIKEAMGPGSMLLLEEIVLPEERVALESALADIVMMVSFASMERRLTEWENLLTKAGLKLVKMWRPEGQTSIGNMAVLEAVREDEHPVKTGEKSA